MKLDVTLIAAAACSAAWLILLATLPDVPGAVNLLYALAMVLYARRVMVGAPSVKA